VHNLPKSTTTHKVITAAFRGTDFKVDKPMLCVHCKSKMRTSLSIDTGYCRFCRSRGHHMP
jgi:uncharacterized CHY-type Zn-finger protein